MTKTEIKNQATELATSEDCTYLQALSAMQTASAAMGNDTVLDTICEMKMEILEEQGLI